MHDRRRNTLRGHRLKASVRHGLGWWWAVGICLACGACAAPGGGSGETKPSVGTGFAGRLEQGRGAPWTILCLEQSGENRAAVVRSVADTLRETPGIRSRDVVVVDELDGFTRLYYGLYYRKTDPRTGRRPTPAAMDEDLRLLKELGTPDGRRLFLQARKVRVPVPDVGPPEWALTSTRAAYTLQVAVFQPEDEFWDFKEAALDYCRILREKGFEAYYHHTPAASMVTVGLFGEDALVPQDKQSWTYQSVDPDGQIRQMPQERSLWRYSEEVVRLQNSSDLLRYNRLNGAVYSALTDTRQKLPVESRLVRVPRLSNEAESSWERLPPS